jgi:hypothetical protein
MVNGDPDVMALHHYAAIGAGVGAAVSVLLRLWSLWADRRRHLAAQRPPDTVDHGEADAKIKSLNQAKAERYLAGRDRHKRSRRGRMVRDAGNEDSELFQKRIETTLATPPETQTGTAKEGKQLEKVLL